MDLSRRCGNCVTRSVHLLTLNGPGPFLIIIITWVRVKKDYVGEEKVGGG
jgi:hypothetical protein